MALARLAALDRRLPFGTATLIASTALGVLLSGTTAAVVKDAAPASVAAAPGASPSAKTPSPGTTAKPEKPDQPVDYLLDVATVQKGLRRMGDGVAGTGPMDLEDAAVIEAGGSKPTNDDRDALRGLGFVRGHSRAWTDGDGTHVLVIVYEWKDSDGPLMFVKGVEQVTTESGNGWKPPMRRAHGVCSDDDGTDDSILAAVGKHSFLVILSHDAGCDDHAVVVTITDAIVKHAARLGA